MLVQGLSNSTVCKRFSNSIAVFFLTALLAVLCVPAVSSAAVLQSTANIAPRVDGPWNIGMEFQVTSNTAVNALGVWEDTSLLQLSHDVGLWLPGNVTNIPDFQATVPSGTGGTLIDGFRYALIGSDVVLTPGNNYVIGAANLGSSGDAFNDPFPAGGFANGPNVTTVANRFVAGAAFAYPVNSDLNVVPRWGGANATFIAAAVPEPSTVTLATLGLLSLGFVGWRRRRR